MDFMTPLKHISQGVGAIVFRNFSVWARYLGPSLTGNVVNPLLYMFAFGFGLGAVVEQMEGVPYLAFVVAGMAGYGATFNAGFETSIGAYSRLKTQRTYDAILATPITLREIILAEMTWAATKGLFSAIGVLIAGSLFGGLPGGVAGFFAALPVLFLGGLCFAAVGMVFTSFATSYEFFAYFFTFWITPNFVFGGVFFSLDRFPPWLQALANLLPTKHLVDALRPLTAGAPLHGWVFCLKILILVAVTAVGYVVAHRQLKKRLFD